MRITVGGGRLRYSQDAGTLLIEAKLLLTCTITVDNGVRFLAVDIKEFSQHYQNIYVFIQQNFYRHLLTVQHSLKIASDGFVCIKTKKGMCGLRRAAVLAHDNLGNKLKPFDYLPCPSTSSIWRHVDRKNILSMCQLCSCNLQPIVSRNFVQEHIEHELTTEPLEYKRKECETQWTPEIILISLGFLGLAQIRPTEKMLSPNIAK